MQETISTEEVKRLAGLSALEFSAQELESFTDEFAQILHFVEQVKNSELADKPITYAAHPMMSLREDAVKEGLTQAQVLQNSPKSKKGGFCVPKMLED